MSELTNALYEFVTSHSMPGLWEKPEYQIAQTNADTKLEQLCGQLEEKQRKLLSELIDEIDLAYAIRSEYIFQAALALSRELSGLVRP